MVALRTWCELRPDSLLAGAPTLLAGPAAPAPGVVSADALYPAFIEMMPLGNRAEDYGVELLALEAGRVLSEQAAYDAFKAGVDADWLRAFHKRFYRVRTAMSDADRAAWHALIGPYAGIPELLRRRAGQVVLAIATSKDRRSVGVLLEAYGIGDLYPEGFVLDKEAGADKRSHMELLKGETGLAFEEMLFVDDKVNHLDRVATLGVRCGLATWGYNGERELAQARDRGHTILELRRLDSQIFADGGN